MCVWLVCLLLRSFFKYFWLLFCECRGKVKEWNEHRVSDKVLNEKKDININHGQYPIGENDFSENNQEKTKIKYESSVANRYQKYRKK